MNDAQQRLADEMTSRLRTIISMLDLTAIQKDYNEAMIPVMRENIVLAVGTSVCLTMTTHKILSAVAELVANFNAAGIQVQHPVKFVDTAFLRKFIDDDGSDEGSE